MASSSSIAKNKTVVAHTHCGFKVYLHPRVQVNHKLHRIRQPGSVESPSRDSLLLICSGSLYSSRAHGMRCVDGGGLTWYWSCPSRSSLSCSWRRCGPLVLLLVGRLVHMCDGIHFNVCMLKRCCLVGLEHNQVASSSLWPGRHQRCRH